MAEQRCKHGFLRTLVECESCGPLEKKARRPRTIAVARKPGRRVLNEGMTVAGAVILTRTRRDERSYCECRCACGEKFEIRADNLRHQGRIGTTAACPTCVLAGRKSNNRGASKCFINLRNVNIGGTVVKRRVESRHGKTHWQAVCVCKKPFVVRLERLRAAQADGTTPTCPACSRAREAKARFRRGRELRASHITSDVKYHSAHAEQQQTVSKIAPYVQRREAERCARRAEVLNEVRAALSGRTLSELEQWLDQQLGNGVRDVG